MPLTPDQIQRLVAQHVHRCITDVETNHFSRQRPLDDGDVEARLEDLDDFDSMTQRCIGTADYRSISPVARDLLNEAGLKLDLSDVEFNLLCDAILQANLQVHDHERKLLRGQPRGIAAATAPENASHSPSPTPSIPKRTVSDLYEEYERSKLSSREFDGNTAEGYRATMAELIECLGDRNPDDYSKAEMNQLRDTWLRLPRNRKKLKAYRDLNIKELMEHEVPEADRRSPRTVLEALGRVKTFFRWCVSMDYCANNNAEVAKVKARKTKRSSFTQDELKAIFHSEFYANSKYRRFYQYWLPLLGLYTGARISELCQLTVDDVRHTDGIDYLTVIDDEEQGRKTKTESSHRSIPIHPMLKELGFLEYVDWLRTAGHTMLIPDVPASQRRPGQKASTWFTKFRRSCGVTRKGIVFHSFRHSANTAAFAADNNAAAVQQTLGHKQAGLGMSNQYMGDLGLAKSEEVIKSLEYGVDVSHLRDGWRKLTFI